MALDRGELATRNWGVGNCSDKHLVLVQIGALAGTLASEEGGEAGSDALHNAGQLPYGGDNRVGDDVGGFLHPVHGAGDQFVGANHLQPGAVQQSVERDLQALHLLAQHAGGSSGVGQNLLHLRPGVFQHGFAASSAGTARRCTSSASSSMRFPLRLTTDRMASRSAIWTAIATPNSISKTVKRVSMLCPGLRRQRQP